MRAMIARAARLALKLLDYDIIKRGRAPSWPFTAEIMKRYGVVPRTVFDIGVATGTPWLYETLPDAEYHLIDPTRESLPHMQAIALRLQATVHNVALGDSDGTVAIAVRAEIGGSSVYEEVGIPEHPIIARYDVPIRRFDNCSPRSSARRWPRSMCRAPNWMYYEGWANACITSMS